MPLSSETIVRFAPLREKPLRWAVTGVAGFIGSNLLEALLLLDQQVVGLDNFSTGRRSNLDDVRRIVGEERWNRFRFREGDIRDPADCVAVCTDAQVVLHQAALGSVPRSIQDPATTAAVNVQGQLNMLIAARAAGVNRFVYATSSSIYGDNAELPKVEDRTGRPLSPYAVTKVVNELFASVFNRTYGYGSIGLRYFNVFGPRQDPAGAYAAVIPRWVDALLSRGPCHVFGDGSTSRDFCYVANVVQANLLAGTVDAPEALDQVYNIAVGNRTSLLDLFTAIRDTVAGCSGAGDTIARITPDFLPFRAGDVQHSHASIDKATRLLGYRPTHDLAAGLRAAIPWYVDAYAATGEQRMSTLPAPSEPTYAPDVR
jgi:UDP-N-acetylglucosamine 4-epimerase